LKPGAAVLDTGCGQGVLLRRLPRSCYSKYVGIDLSGSAISVAQEHGNECSAFLVADCEEYSPAEHFDVMVFNEVLCCLHDPLRTVSRYARSLNPAGLLLVSLCTAARGSDTILRRLKQAYQCVDEVRIVHSARKVSWVCTALRPDAPGGRV
jgi:2-polyprenyl-3-methyl-5-hydroxy-6-metoxy-1,4-benzoquinol methylase